MFDGTLVLVFLFFFFLTFLSHLTTAPRFIAPPFRGLHSVGLVMIGVSLEYAETFHTDYHAKEGNSLDHRRAGQGSGRPSIR